ncbi:MAG TPA: hypothetical protein VJK30_04095 [Coxiellaceae bacterium]|nr:hypothetical protein [Coxiellaceae bacterium]
MKKKKSTYSFMLVLSGVNDKTKNLEDVLYAAGCDDALINFRNGTAYLDFDRQAFSFEDAVISAIKAVENTSLNIKVMSVAPDYYVSESEVAERLHLKRQTVSLWFKGERHAKNHFPAPAIKLTAKSPLWRWYDVLEWLYQQKKIENSELLEHAKLIEHINMILFDRNLAEKKYRQKIIKKLI